MDESTHNSEVSAPPASLAVLEQVDVPDAMMQFCANALEFAGAVLTAPHFAALFALKFGLDTTGQLLQQRAMRRASYVVQELIVEKNLDREHLAEWTLDLVSELRDLIDKTATAVHDKKIEYLTQILKDEADEKRITKVDRYFRFKNWIEQLDLETLASLAQMEDLNDPATKVKQSSYKDNNGTNLFTSLQFVNRLLRSQGQTRTEFITQLTGVGLAQFDRGGGAEIFNSAAHVIWHRDVLDFATHLRKSAGSKGLTEVRSE